MKEHKHLIIVRRSLIHGFISMGVGICLSVLVPVSLFAANGAKLIGSGATSPLMGGTGCVEGEDTGSLMINPASVTKIGRRIDVAGEIALVDIKLDTSAATNAVFRNDAGEHTSNADVILIPHTGISYHDELGSPWYYGFAASVVSGLEVDYKKSRRSPAVTRNEFDRHVKLFTYEFVPTVGYKPTEKWALGVSPVATLNRLEADMANGGLQETVGHDNGDHAWGLGYNIGTIYDISKYLSAGCSYKSPRWYERFDAYNDSLDKLDSPPEYIAGIALKPIDKWVIESNVKFIHWRWVDKIRKGPDHGGYGWDDQWVFGFGTRYQLTERLKVRLGYNFGESQIDEDVVYANGLSPLISEHHVGVGLGYRLSNHIEINGGWLHIFKNSMTDNGSGDALSRNGAGTRISTEIDSLYVGLSYLF